MSSAPGKTMTAEELLALGEIGPCELIDGELVRMTPSGFEHGWIGLRIGRFLAEHVERKRLGYATGAETGFRIRRHPDTVRAPDVAFVARERSPGRPTRAFFEGAPDLAVEVVSPTDRWSDVQAQAQEWLAAGCRMVWIVDPATSSVTVALPDGSSQVLKGEDELTGGDVLPGLRLLVSEVLADPQP